jgi:drug/metabolite transporter (DMT)-like permease
LILVALGVVVGFPLLSALALRHMAAGHAIVFTGLLPLSTAAFAVLRGGERPDGRFWLFAILGGGCVVAFALAGGGASTLEGDLLMLAAVAVCGFGYAEGAVLSRRLGGWQVISWALTLSLPIMLGALLFAAPPHWAAVGAPAYAGLAYVSLFSMLIGFVSGTRAWPKAARRPWVRFSYCNRCSLSSWPRRCCASRLAPP